MDVEVSLHQEINNVQQIAGTSIGSTDDPLPRQYTDLPTLMFYRFRPAQRARDKSLERQSQ
jgi:hypothetical protein